MYHEVMGSEKTVRFLCDSLCDIDTTDILSLAFLHNLSTRRRELVLTVMNRLLICTTKQNYIFRRTKALEYVSRHDFQYWEVDLGSTVRSLLIQVGASCRVIGVWIELASAPTDCSTRGSGKYARYWTFWHKSYAGKVSSYPRSS